jgi:hypothetical protein
MIPLETTIYRAPLGLQFIDSVTSAPVADGLVVTAWPAGVPWAARVAAQSPVSAIMGFGQLPGLASYENALTQDPDTLTWSVPSAGQPFEVRVADPLGRYLPELLALTVPQLALVTPSLYSAPARPVPPGFATVRGEVSLATSPPQPAAWAVVQIAVGGNSYLTFADEAGRYLTYLPYPEALPPLTGSPGGVPLDQMTWPITVSVLYQPSAQTRLADAAPGDPPELTSLLKGQGAAGIVVGGGTQNNLTATLTFGTPLLLMLPVVSA